MFSSPARPAERRYHEKCRQQLFYRARAHAGAHAAPALRREARRAC